MTTTDSAQVTPGASGPVAVTRAERVGARAPAAVMAERRAWLLLWLAFATFCALVFAAAKFTVVDGTWGVVNGAYQSTTPGTAGTAHLNTRSVYGATVAGDFTISADASVAETGSSCRK